MIERGEDILGFELPADGQLLIESAAGNKAAGERLCEGRCFHPLSQPPLPREEQQRCAHHLVIPEKSR
jgi:hypothetical protein